MFVNHRKIVSLFFLGKGSEEAVSKAPRFISPLSNVMARAGQKIKLECEVEGEPHPELIWIHNDKVIPETRDVQVSFAPQFCYLFGVLAQKSSILCKIL